jgi:integrase
MAGKRKTPKLRQKDGCFVTDIYKPDGRRTTISFGSPGQRTAGEIYAAFGKWLDLFNQHPHRVLVFRDPYEAIDRIINRNAILTLGELYDKYLEWAVGYFPALRDGRECPELVQIRRIEKFLRTFADWPVAGFGPEELRTVQEAMVAYRYTRNRRGSTKSKHAGPGNGKDGADAEDASKPLALGRSSINRMINQIHKMWRWGIGRMITTEAQCHLMKEVRPLRAGKTTAKDAVRRRPITEEELAAVVAKMPTVTGDMVRLCWLTAMRPSEVCRMRPIDILRDDEDCWLYIPGRDEGPVGDHETAHHQRVRAIPLTRQAQDILRPRLKGLEPTEAIFSPTETIREMRKRRSKKRQTPVGQGNSTGTNRRLHPMIAPGAQYTPHSFAGAVKRGCDSAGVERFTPYDIRRTAATRIRAQLSKDAAKLILGHVSSTTTEIYLLDEVQERMKVAKQLDATEGESPGENAKPEKPEANSLE